MNDITALIATMKAAAEKASDRGELIVQVNTGNVLALVEALEKALEKAQQHEKLTEAERQAYLGLISQRDERIAELESRTVTVKLPKRSVGEVMHMSGFSHDYAEGWCSGNDNAINEMKLAGIQVIEGEGQ